MRQQTISSADIPAKTVARFWLKVDDTPKGNSCWEWTGAEFRKGYGNFHVPGLGNIGAHIVAWLLTHQGESLEPNECVLHDCDNPPCCRPRHLFKGSKKDNTHDAIKKNRLKPFGRPYSKKEKIATCQWRIEEVCGSPSCRERFVRKQHNQRYCNPTCAHREWVRKNPERAEAIQLRCRRLSGR